jgi:hypothetical protein
MSHGMKWSCVSQEELLHIVVGWDEILARHVKGDTCRRIVPLH